MTNAHHDSAVQLLTDHQRFVRLVVQREMKGPLEPPSPRSPVLKGVSPSGYRTGFKRSAGDSPSSDDINQKYISNTSPVVHQQNIPRTVTPTAVNNNAKSNGIESSAVQPVPAPRRLNSIGGTDTASVNGNQTSGNKSEDEDVQVIECLTIFNAELMVFVNCLNHIRDRGGDVASEVNLSTKLRPISQLKSYGFVNLTTKTHWTPNHYMNPG